MKYAVILVLVFMYSPLCLLGQSVSALEGGFFTNGELVGKLHEFEHSFKQSESCKRRFAKFNRSRKTQRVINYTSLGFGGVGIISGTYYAIFVDDDTSSIITSEVVGIGIGFLGLGLGFTTALLGNAIVLPIKSHRKNKLLYECADQSLGDLYMPSIQLHLTAAGVGVKYVF